MSTLGKLWSALRARFLSAHSVDLILTFVGAELTLVLSHTSNAANGSILAALVTGLLAVVKAVQTTYTSNPPGK